MIKTFRDTYALILLAVLCLWFALIAFWFVPFITTEKLDPMMSLIAGLGIGGVTNALIVLITLVTQFYFRKRPADEVSETKGRKKEVANP